jgi:hypothetical protein
MEIVDRIIRYSFLDKEGAKKKMEELESKTERAKTVWQNFKERLSWKYLSLIYSRDFINNIYPYIELLVTSIIATRLRNEARKKRQLPLETFNPQELISAFFDQVQINYTNKTAAELKEIIQKSILKTFKK